MSADPGFRGAVLDWVKTSGLLTVTVLGILLFIVLSVPATIFYGRLGTTPGEVGITYSSLLSGSTLGILVILLVLTVTFFAASFIIAFVGFGIRVGRFLDKIGVLELYSGKANWELADGEFETRIAAMRELSSLLPEIAGPDKVKWEEEEPRSRRIRDLKMLGVLTVDQQTELNALIEEEEPVRAKMRDEPSMFQATLAATKHWIKRHGKTMLLIYPLVTIVAILPTIAYIQAGQVANGKPYIGSQLNFFDYRADSVFVTPASEAVSPDLQSLVGKRLFFLGQNSQDMIFYFPLNKVTIRIPSTAAIVTSIP